MAYLQRFRDLFLYAGVGKEEYEKLLPSIRAENQELLRVFSQIAGWMFFTVYFVSVFSGGFTTVNTPTYLFSALVMVFIMLCTRFFLPTHPERVMVFVYLFEIMLYVFGIRISMLHANMPAVSAVAFLLVSPLLFYDRPARLSGMIVVVAAVFCVMVACFKVPAIAVTDIWNTITFGAVAIVTTLFIMSIKIRSLAQSRQIEYMSQTDLLTGTKNRNHFESRLKEYPELCKRGIVCVYADVNGLHETNNKQGHRTGDQMLQDVASVMQQVFGEEDTYRIGGDEFVAMAADADIDEISSKVARAGADLERLGYFVSFGTSEREKIEDAIDMNGLVNEAESNMFASKRAYYAQASHDRRHR